MENLKGFSDNKVIPTKKRYKPIQEGSEIDKVGTTRKSHAEMEEFAQKWVEKNSRYNILNKNCQNFATKFLAFLDVEVSDLGRKVQKADGGFIKKDSINFILQLLFFLAYVFTSYGFTSYGMSN